MMEPMASDRQGIAMEEFTSRRNYDPKVRRNKRIAKFILVGSSVLFIVGALSALLHYQTKNQALFNKIQLELNKRSADSCSNIRDDSKFDCHPDGDASEKSCQERKCCWRPPSHKLPSSKADVRVPSCYFPLGFKGYVISSIASDNGVTEVFLTRKIPSGFPGDVQKVIVSITDHSDTFEIKITDEDKERYETVYPKLKKTFDSKTINQLYVEVQSNGLLTIFRQGTTQVIFETDLSQMIFSDQFLQLSSKLPSNIIYGLGEHKERMLKSTAWNKYTMLNRGADPQVHSALYGSHPFYLAIEKNGRASGVVLLNSNAMDIILQPAPAITYRPIGGIFHFLVLAEQNQEMSSPNSVVSNYIKWIGLPELPPYWSLGFHLCRYGYNSLTKTKEAWKRTRDAKIPFDVQWNDIDYMDRFNDFTYDKKNYAGLPEFVEELHKNKMHYVMIVDPGISNVEPSGKYPPYDKGVELDIFVKNSTGNIFVGKVWNKATTVFPDFSHPKIDAYWKSLIVDFWKMINFDGIWIDMNEPENFYDGQKNGCPSTNLDNPPYVPGVKPLNKNTLCMSAKHFSTTHYNVHNLYGISEADATNRALKQQFSKRPFIISRSSFIGQGKYSGHWTGDVFSTWEDLKLSIPGILNFNMFGVPMVGADICGFHGNTTEELCARWTTLGAFYPFSRNHNDLATIDQDPVSMGKRVVQAAKSALEIRYTLLPYIYSQFVLASLQGHTVARPLFFEFPLDEKTYDLDTQFLLGPAFMIIPILEKGTTSVEGYFPEGVWYDYKNHKLIKGPVSKQLKAQLEEINLFIRGGHILPIQIPALTTVESRGNVFQLIVPLDPVSKTSKGDLFWDDGDSLNFHTKKEWNHITFLQKENELNIVAEKYDYQVKMTLEDIMILGVDTIPKDVRVNSKVSAFKYDVLNKVVTVLIKNWPLQTNMTLVWTF